jgi:hypothetical protein
MKEKTMKIPAGLVPVLALALVLSLVTCARGRGCPDLNPLPCPMDIYDKAFCDDCEVVWVCL